jgi:uncharacterized membrane protein YjjB (DUF3815 family)
LRYRGFEVSDRQRRTVDRVFGFVSVVAVVGFLLLGDPVAFLAGALASGIFGILLGRWRRRRRD